jgi:murein DD-endopeptidase MepM/ murein hydrolase activator NlpD
VRIALATLVALVVLGIGGIFVLAKSPHMDVPSPPAAIGDETPVAIRVVSPHGVKKVTVTLDQDGKSASSVVVQRKAHRLGLFKSEAPADFTFSVGRKLDPALHDGKAQLTISAQANDLVGHSDTKSFEVMVATEPPHVVADGVQHYINQAGAELVTFTPTGYVTDSGVQAGTYRFRSFPLPSNPKERFSLFALPWDQPASAPIFVYATNPTGAVAKGSFWYKTFPKVFRNRDIEITDAFMTKVEDDIDPNGKGDPLQRFLYINREMRKQNNEQLSQMRDQTEAKWLWNRPFFAILGARESNFADHRNYIYHGKQIDQQTHLGFDIAGTQHMTIPAANDGRVIWAARLGIYGNCIVIDHGYGLQTIYGHLSEFLVKKGDRVKREQPIGKSGQTGLAGGDHLHFSMQVDGVEVNPIEWWDEHWIKDRIWSKVPPPAQ